MDLTTRLTISDISNNTNCGRMNVNQGVKVKIKVKEWSLIDFESENKLYANRDKLNERNKKKEFILFLLVNSYFLWLHSILLFSFD